MKYIFLCLIIIAIYLYSKNGKKENNKSNEYGTETQSDTTLSIQGSYKQKWMFTYNEKSAYRKIKEITDKYGLEVFSKVRLLDLVEPVSGNPKYKTYLYKIQAKHVDFVICDKKLVARYVIELDDKSHDTEEKQERDKFVDEVLKSTGYKVLRIREKDLEDLEQIIKAKLFLE